MRHLAEGFGKCLISQLRKKKKKPKKISITVVQLPCFLWINFSTVHDFSMTIFIFLVFNTRAEGTDHRHCAWNAPGMFYCIQSNSRKTNITGLESTSKDPIKSEPFDNGTQCLNIGKECWLLRRRLLSSFAASFRNSKLTSQRTTSTLGHDVHH